MLPMRVRMCEMTDHLLGRVFPRVLLPPFMPSIYFQRRPVPRNRLVRVLYSLWGRAYELVVTERVVETPFVFRNLTVPPGTSILDFGCSGSTVCLSLASLGYRVVGVDLRPFPLTHSNLRFFQGEFEECGFPEAEFDAVVAVSAVEHCGLGAYGESARERGDRRVVDEIFRVLKPGGRLLLTVPVGRAGETSWYRVYDRAGLRTLLSRFDVLKCEYYVAVGRQRWLPATEDEIADVDSTSGGSVHGVACVVAGKP